jgi:hypothetical protein
MLIAGILSFALPDACRSTKGEERLPGEYTFHHLRRLLARRDGSCLKGGREERE